MDNQAGSESAAPDAKHRRQQANRVLISALMNDQTRRTRQSSAALAFLLTSSLTPAPANASDLTLRQVVETLFKAPPASQPDFADKDLSSLDLSGLDFKQARLTRANLLGADLTDANLSKADLSGAKLGSHTLGSRQLQQREPRRSELLPRCRHSRFRGSLDERAELLWRESERRSDYGSPEPRRSTRRQPRGCELGSA
jgi:hypothetical protein